MKLHGKNAIKFEAARFHFFVVAKTTALVVFVPYDTIHILVPFGKQQRQQR